VTDTVFDVQNVTYRYNSDVTALNGITLAIERGTRVAILGANGSGKSTLLRILDGLYFPEGGSVTAFGEQLTEDRPYLAFGARTIRLRQRFEVQAVEQLAMDVGLELEILRPRGFGTRPLRIGAALRHWNVKGQ